MNCNKLPQWVKSGAITATLALLLETLYITAVLTKASLVFVALQVHIILLFPLMLVARFFISPQFFVKNLIPSVGAVSLMIFFWFMVGALIGYIAQIWKKEE